MFPKLVLALIVTAPFAARAQTESPATPPAPAVVAPAPAAAVPSSDPGAASEEYDVRLKQTDRRLSFGLFGGISQFARAGGSLQGTNLEGVVDYAMHPRWAGQFTITQSLALGGGLALAYTGFRLGPSYALRGEWMRRGSSLVINGRETISVKPTDSNLLAIDAAADQILFNGQARIVPATGVSLGIRYDRRMFGYPLSFMARYGSLTVNSLPASVMTAGVGLIFRF